MQFIGIEKQHNIEATGATDVIIHIDQHHITLKQKRGRISFNDKNVPGSKRILLNWFDKICAFFVWSISNELD